MTTELAVISRRTALQVLGQRDVTVLLYFSSQRVSYCRLSNGGCARFLQNYSTFNYLKMSEKCLNSL